MVDLGYLGIEKDFPTVKSVLPIRKKKNTSLSNDVTPRPRPAACGDD